MAYSMQGFFQAIIQKIIWGIELTQDLFRYGLFFSNWQFVTVILFIGYVIINRTTFALGTLLYFCSMVINACLKSLFRIPLNPEVFSTPGWAFPSGHTQALAVLLIYICWHYRKPWLGATSVCCFFISTSSMVYFGYHDWFDIAGGFIAALLIVFGFIFSTKTVILHRHTWGAILVGITILLAATILYKNDVDYRWTWSATGASIAFYFSWIALEKEKKQTYGPAKLTALIIINFIICLLLLSKDIKMTIAIYAIRGALIGFWAGYVTAATYTAFKQSIPRIRSLIAYLLESHIRY